MNNNRFLFISKFLHFMSTNEENHYSEIIQDIFTNQLSECKNMKISHFIIRIYPKIFQLMNS